MKAHFNYLADDFFFISYQCKALINFKETKFVSSLSTFLLSSPKAKSIFLNLKNNNNNIPDMQTNNKLGHILVSFTVFSIDVSTQLGLKNYLT